jgi:hypothetical protein
MKDMSRKAASCFRVHCDRSEEVSRAKDILTHTGELRDRAATTQKQNISVLSDAQKMKLTMLSDAIKLAPIISEAQSGNLLGSVGFSPFFFSSSFGNTIVGITGYPTIFGCGGPGVSIFRSGDFSSSLPVNGNPTESGRNLGAQPDPVNGLFVGNGNPGLLPRPNPWFNRTQPK